MSKLTRFLLATAAVLLPITLDSLSPATAQERQGCYMITEFGRLVELDELCPTAATFDVPATPAVETSTGQALGTGDIQVTLRWTSVDDLDLAVTDPSGEVVAYFNPSVPSGGQLDVDANAGCGGTTVSPIENVFWPTGAAPTGNYNLAVNLFTRCEQSNTPISFSVRLLVRGETRTFEGTVSDGEPTITFPFSL